MRPDLPAVPTKGTNLLLRTGTYTAAGGSPDQTGLIIAPDGRLAITTAGAGLAVHLGPADLVQLGLTMIQLGHALAGREAEAAAAAGADLARIVGEAGHA